MSSCLKGDSPESPVAASPAIYPITVLSPVKITTPLQDPSLQSVPKNARFLVSSGLSGWVHSWVLGSNNDSPVKLELSTFMPWLSNIRISAGIRLPNSTITISPTTKSFAGNLY